MDFFRQKKNKYLVLVLVITIFISICILVFSRISEKTSGEVFFIKEYNKPEINWEILESPGFKELEMF